MDGASVKNEDALIAALCETVEYIDSVARSLGEPHRDRLHGQATSLFRNLGGLRDKVSGKKRREHLCHVEAILGTLIDYAQRVLCKHNQSLANAFVQQLRNMAVLIAEILDSWSSHKKNSMRTKRFGKNKKNQRGKEKPGNEALARRDTGDSRAERDGTGQTAN